MTRDCVVAHEIEVTLIGAELVVDRKAVPWRRFLLRADANMLDLHIALQLVCGWENMHLFAFSTADGEVIAAPPDDFGADMGPSAAKVTLAEVVADGHRRLTYLYDFGDSWEHEVVIGAEVESDDDVRLQLVDGVGTFPPEDVGGLGGWHDAREVVARHDAGDRLDEDDQDRLEWLGDWRPDSFDLAAERARVNR
jgi:hypothetical protein